MPARRPPLLGPLAVLVLPACVAAAEPTREQADYFEKKVRPILTAHCFECHSRAGKARGGLRLDSLASALKGGDAGPALAPGKPNDSLLVRAVEYHERRPRMPPSGKLADEQVAVLREWVRLGAPWPGGSETKKARPRGTISDEDRRWWAFQPLGKATPPEVRDTEWAKNPLDRFLRARLDAEGLEPSPPAGRAALIRRVTFDLIGLPPTPEEVEAFIEDRSADAYEKLVDRLLASPRYGERWARHWLDLARYAESDGFRIDDYRPNAWRYRDYVVGAFNADKPYDRFVREQLAGDELFPDDPDALAATGFLRHTIYEYNQRDVRTQWSNMLDELTDVTGDLFLGLGMGCARCHDHKFDPLLQRDYYRLRAFFAAMQPHDDLPLAKAARVAEHGKQLAAWERKTADLRAQIAAIEGPARARAEKDAVAKFPDDIQAMLTSPPDKRSPLEAQLAALAYRQVQYEFDRLDAKFKDEQKKQLLALRKELAAAAEKPEPLPLALTLRDVGPEAPPTFLPKQKDGEPLAPGFPSVFDEGPARVTPPRGLASTGRRTALAEWIVRPDNPLTARVIVNRVWQYHFGRGLVATASDFGRLGDPPTHPELLDWLARRFVQDGWSFKKLHRLIVTSAAYRQSATAPAPAAALKKDPENRLLWRGTTRRLDAEQVRDSLLAATGRLDLTAGGPAVEPTQPRRTLYTKVRRNTRDPLLDAFDAPEGFASTAQRNVTTTPTQALLLINSSFMLQQAQAFAERLRREKSDDAARLDRAFRLAFGRPPTDAERKGGLAFLDQQAKRIGGNADDARAAALADLCHVLLNANEFLYVD
jgi:hypothetical protein